MEHVLRDIYKILVVIFVLQIMCCSTNRSNRIDADTSLNDSLAVAVLNFQYSGHLLSSGLANNTADRLTSELYLNRKLKVIDRSLIRNALSKYETSNKGRFSISEIKNIGGELGAGYLILGSIHSLGSIENTFEEENCELLMTIRLLRADTAEVVGIAQHSVVGEEDINKLINRLVEELVFSLKWF
jgi:TolB-like protein